MRLLLFRFLLKNSPLPRSRDVLRHHIFLPQLMSCDPLCEVDEDGHHRDSQEHAGHTEQFSAKCHGEDDPEWLDARGVAHQLGPEEEAVELLQAQDHDEEGQGFDRVDRQLNDQAGDRTYYGAEVRDHIRDRNEDTDQQRVRKRQDIHQDEADESDDQ